MPYSELRHDSRNPFQWAVIGGVWLYSIYQMTTDAWPGQIEENAGEVYRWIWGCTLSVGASLSLVGMIYSLGLGYRKVGNRTPKGLAFEASGLYLFGLSLLVYGGALASLAKSSAIMSAVIFTSCGVASLIRGLWIQRGLRRVARGEPASGKFPVLPRE